MKQGSTDDPFAADSEETDTEPETDETDMSAPDSTSSDLPWKYQRENARDGRDRTKQLHLQASTERQEGAFKAEVEGELDESVQLTDLREAALLVAMEHPAEVAEKLREWGYDY